MNAMLFQTGVVDPCCKTQNLELYEELYCHNTTYYEKYNHVTTVTVSSKILF